MILILHGWQGSGPQHWQVWLTKELKNKSINVLMPELPDMHHPHLSKWLETVYRLFKQHEIKAVVCHSLACVFWTHFCKKYPEIHVNRTLLVAPISFNVVIPEVKSFFPVHITYSDYLNSADSHLLVLSNNDPYCSIKDAKYIESMLNIPTLWLEKSGHINIASGFGPWPFAYEWITNKL